jgi:hypothetical protein
MRREQVGVGRLGRAAPTGVPNDPPKAARLITIFSGEQSVARLGNEKTRRTMMRTINEALKNAIDMRTGPTEQEIQSNLDSLLQLARELERPQYRELMRFAFAWQKFDRSLSSLESKIQERLAEKPNPVNELLKKILKKN